MPQAIPSRPGQGRTVPLAPHAIPAPAVPPPTPSSLDCPAPAGPPPPGSATPQPGSAESVPTALDGVRGDSGVQANSGLQGNHALRELRLRRFWTQADFAAAFEARSRQIGRSLSLSVRQVRRWESDNPPLPLPAYQAVLEALFGVPIERMGFQPRWAREQAGAPGPGPGGAQGWPKAAPGGAGAPGRGGAGVARSPQDDHERQDPVKRRQFMTGAMALGTAAVAAPDPALAARSPLQEEAADRLADRTPGRTAQAPGSSAVDPALVSGYAVITEQHRGLYWSVAAPSMFTAVAAHSDLGLGLLRAASSPALRARLARPVAETALLAARLAFFDLQQPQVAEGYFAAALDAARESADRALVGAVLAHMAFVPAFAGRPRRARDLMAQARRQSDGAAGRTQRSWMYAVESEIEARGGGPAAAADLIARSEAQLGAGPAAGPGEAPDWLDYFDASRLAGFKGFCQLATGRSADAAACLERTLRTLPATGAKQRSIVLADLALARARQGELEESGRLLGGAIAQLQRSWYATGASRVETVRRALSAAKAPVRVLAPLDEAWHALGCA